jgi:hypothetical protein
MFAAAADSPNTTDATVGQASRLSNLLYPLLATVRSPHTDATTTTQALVALNAILTHHVIHVEE